MIRSPTKLFQWWDKLVEPVLKRLDQEKGLVAEAFSVVLDILTLGDYGGTDPSAKKEPNPFAERVLNIWLAEYQVAQAEGVAHSYKELQVRETLIAYGKKKPEDFLRTLNVFMVKAECRTRILSLLTDFVQSKPPHLHQILNTPLFNNILFCLQKDTSTTVVTLAMTALIMILPHIPSSLVPYLPTLFKIYTRLLFWEQELSASAGSADRDGESHTAMVPSNWEQCTFSPDVDDTNIPLLINYFTALYGLYPINFMDYVRKPQRYLRHADAGNGDDVDVQPSEIRHKSERFQQCHLLHPNFYTLTIESEKTDFGRWLKSDPAAIVAEYTALCVHEHLSDTAAISQLPAAMDSDLCVPEEADDDEADDALLSGADVVEPSELPKDGEAENWGLTQSTAADSLSNSRVQSAAARDPPQSSRPSNRGSTDARARDVGADSPTLPPHLAPVSSSSQLQEMINSNKVIKSGLRQSLPNDSVPSLNLSHPESGHEKSLPPLPPAQQRFSSPLSNAEMNARNQQVPQLYRQILLLKNDLNFERYLKEQHLAHIGELRRRQIKEVAAEAETQNLIISNRNLKSRLEEAKRMEMQVRRESEKIRALGKKLEADLSSKLRALREEQKKWKTERETLRRELDSAKEEVDKLTKQLCEAEVQLLNARQNAHAIEKSVDELERLRAEVQSLNASQRECQAKELAREAAISAAAQAESCAVAAEMLLKAKDADIAKMQARYEAEIRELEDKVAAALDNGRGRESATAAAKISMLESAVTASRTREAELQKQVASLQRKNAALQTSLHEVRVAAAAAGVNISSGKMAARPPLSRHATAETPTTADDDRNPVSPVVLSSPLALRNRLHRGFSDPEMFDSASTAAVTAVNKTQPLTMDVGSPSPAPTGPLPPRPSTPPGGASAAGPSSGSPQGDRYFGRGKYSSADVLAFAREDQVSLTGFAGGVQSTIRKERKDKKDESAKKDKKPVGFKFKLPGT